jgi:hypothetical protein
MIERYVFSLAVAVCAPASRGLLELPRWKVHQINAFVLEFRYDTSNIDSLLGILIAFVETVGVFLQLDALLPVTAVQNTSRNFGNASLATLADIQSDRIQGVWECCV